MSPAVSRTCVICGRQFDHPPQRGRRPMTCSPDCQRIRKSHKSEESRDRHVALGCPPGKHGTATGYSFYKCHCFACTRWARLYKRSRRAAGS